MQNVAPYKYIRLSEQGDVLHNYSAKNWPFGPADYCSPFVF